MYSIMRNRGIEEYRNTGIQDFVTYGLFIISQAMTNLIFVSISCTLEYFVRNFQQNLAFSASYNAVLC